jgi:hypothetical protein
MGFLDSLGSRKRSRKQEFPKGLKEKLLENERRASTVDGLKDWVEIAKRVFEHLPDHQEGEAENKLSEESGIVAGSLVVLLWGLMIVDDVELLSTSHFVRQSNNVVGVVIDKPTLDNPFVTVLSIGAQCNVYYVAHVDNVLTVENLRHMVAVQKNPYGVEMLGLMLQGFYIFVSTPFKEAYEQHLEEGIREGAFHPIAPPAHKPIEKWPGYLEAIIVQEPAIIGKITQDWGVFMSIPVPDADEVGKADPEWVAALDGTPDDEIPLRFRIVGETPAENLDIISRYYVGFGAEEEIDPKDETTKDDEVFLVLSDARKLYQKLEKISEYITDMHTKCNPPFFIVPYNKPPSSMDPN